MGNSIKLGNYNINWCDKHGRYTTSPNSSLCCPRCKNEKKWYKVLFKSILKFLEIDLN